MSVCIGVDFDNTIACYDSVFSIVARQDGLLDIDDLVFFAKAQVKEHILAGENGDINWQRLQGQIYGKHMNLASVFPGFAEFLVLTKIRNHKICIVSHKSEHGHFDEEKISLRDEAMKWLIANQFVGTGPLMLSKDEVFFRPTRETKIEQIIRLNCTDFIDDLQEVFDEVSFPAGVNKYLFDPQHKASPGETQKIMPSWRKITNEILGEWSADEVMQAVQIKFPSLPVVGAVLKKGRGNSKIYQLILTDGSKYVLKVYPDRQIDSRKRLETEFSASHILSTNGFPVMTAVAKDENMNWGIYSWIEGDIETADESFIDNSVDFISRLKKVSRETEYLKTFPKASEACLSGEEIVKQIRERLIKLENVDIDELTFFLQQQFLPVFEFAYERAKKISEALFNTELPAAFLIPSPSDFGAHNAIRNEAGKTVYIDFEYFGWDDPVKLVSDFYWHPAMDLQEELRLRWFQKANDVFNDDLTFSKRLAAYLPLFGLRWCLILLNEFLPHRLEQRIQADEAKGLVVKDIQKTQLKKAGSLLNNINQIMIYHG